MAHAHKVIPLIQLPQVVPCLYALFQHRFGYGVKTHVLAVHRRISRCKDVNEGLEGERGDR